MFSAKIVADSKNTFGDRITTFVVTFPRYILAEFNTHRMFSRNSASSRAIPFPKLLESVRTNPFIPIAWQKHHSGMQGNEYFTDKKEIIRLNNQWMNMRWHAMDACESLFNDGVTKQLCNRPLEPFMWHTCIVTATEWENFFALRCPKYAFEAPYSRGQKEYFRSKKDYVENMLGMGSGEEYKQSTLEVYKNFTVTDWLKINEGMGEIHIMELAEKMWDSYNENTPKQLQPGEWHIPFGDQINDEEVHALISPDEVRKSETLWDAVEPYFIKIATTRCAQISYVVADSADKPMDYKKMIERHDKLAADGHWSPFEHCARVMTDNEYNTHVRGRMILDDQDDNKIWDVHDSGVLGWSGNFRGFIQYRKTFENENITVK